MSETPEYTGYDARRPSPKVVGIKEAIKTFYDSVPEGQVSLNLGCGQTRMDGFVNVDWMPDDAVDVAYDLFAPNWPFDDESVGFVYMSHLLEHVPPTAWATFWSEMFRVCAEGARVMIMSPFGRSSRHLQDPTHCQPIVHEKFNYLNRSWRESNKLNHGYYGGKDLNFLSDIRPWKLWHQDYTMKDDAAKLWAEVHYWNAIDDCIWFLRRFKTQEAIDEYSRKVESEMNGQFVQGQPVSGSSLA